MLQTAQIRTVEEPSWDDTYTSHHVARGSLNNHLNLPYFLWLPPKFWSKSGVHGACRDHLLRWPIVRRDDIQTLAILDTWNTPSMEKLWRHTVVSENRGTRKSIHFNRIFPYKPTILGYPHDYGNPHMYLCYPMLICWLHKHLLQPRNWWSPWSDMPVEMTFPCSFTVWCVLLIVSTSLLATKWLDSNFEW